jgi:outer membrane protein
LDEAIERSLCHDPTLRQALSDAQLRAAQLGQKRAAYLPRIDGQSHRSWERSTVEYEDVRETVRSNSRTQSGTLNLSWILFDSGRREAALDGARELLAAANADQNAAMQRAFLDAAQLFFAVQAADRRLTAAEQVLALAQENFVAASERHQAGAAALADRLQAQTAYTQANLRRSRERGASASAQGVLALKMGLAASEPVRVATDETNLPTQQYLEHVDDLIAMARKKHPMLIAAQARAAAADATVAEVKAAVRPTLALTGNLTQAKNRIPDTLGPGSDRRQGTIGLQLSIPIFRGFEHTYQVREAQAQAAVIAAERDAQRQRISMDVWTQYASLKMETENLIHTTQLVQQSMQSLEIMQGRYQSGVGSMTDVLNAMGAYSSAREAHIEATRSWQVSRLSLAGSLGRLGFWDLQAAED